MFFHGKRDGKAAAEAYIKWHQSGAAYVYGYGSVYGFYAFHKVTDK
jgi:hypothetical protein